MVAKHVIPEITHTRAPFCIGAFTERVESHEIMGGHFNGKIESPSLFKRALTKGELEALERGVPAIHLSDAVVATWDFSQDVSTRRVVDRSGHGYHGQAVNMPARAVTGHNWSGSMFSRFSELPN